MQNELRGIVVEVNSRQIILNEYVSSSSRWIVLNQCYVRFYNVQNIGSNNTIVHLVGIGGLVFCVFFLCVFWFW